MPIFEKTEMLVKEVCYWVEMEDTVVDLDTTRNNIFKNQNNNQIVAI